ncbi:MAG TPA: hypothetical protein VLZ29_03930 [Sulfurimonas sp.]|uniref:hypothetical protein n=1 Tax=Sulfurimonas sp. TaxID=2022749 RepID=UPI002D04508A|nr:hypothetical protein [Sulfurimonas sp.]HUH42243.1 hypothetical protein [Sulfurimonas sp.]
MFEFIKELMTITTGLAATGFSFYFAWQKIGKSVKASYSIYGKTLSAIRLNDIIISNYKNRPIEIYSIQATIDDKYLVEVERFDSPIILKSLETIKIKTTPLSDWYCNNDDINMSNLLSDGNITLYITTNTKIIKCKTLKHETMIFSKKFKNFKYIYKHTAKYNDIVYTKDVLYAINYLENNIQKTVFVFKGGLMSDTILGFNGLPEELLISKNKLKEYYKSKGLNVFVYEKGENNVFK